MKKVNKQFFIIVNERNKFTPRKKESEDNIRPL
jgi:hypothetical protein